MFNYRAMYSETPSKIMIFSGTWQNLFSTMDSDFHAASTMGLQVYVFTAYLSFIVIFSKTDLKQKLKKPDLFLRNNTFFLLFYFKSFLLIKLKL